jgi:hypothetical protein
VIYVGLALVCSVAAWGAEGEVVQGAVRGVMGSSENKTALEAGARGFAPLPGESVSGVASYCPGFGLWLFVAQVPTALALVFGCLSLKSGFRLALGLALLVREPTANIQQGARAAAWPSQVVVVVPRSWRHSGIWGF